MTRLDGRVAWITGGGRGIGASIALAMAREGADIAVSSRSIDELNVLAEKVRQMGRRAVSVTAEAMSFEAIRSAAATIREQLGAIDILVNNAGGGAPPPDPGDASPELLDDQAFIDDVNLNLFSAYRASQAVLPSMLERGYGRIINIGSGYAKRSGGAPAYTAAKHGLVGLTRSMAALVAQKGVTINCLCPGWTNTRLVDIDAIAKFAKVDVETMRARIESENLQKRILEPEELGPMAVLLAAPESSGITGQVISVDGGYGV
jgi:NAD(P)-dependent dehydrogenase (short-subunit alcohol dehydrogenase family)